MALGRPLGAKLFLEGKEVPFIGATITTAVNQASIAYVDLVPHQAINDIKARTHVAITVRDFNNPTGGIVGFPYVLAWEGEVFGFNFGKTTTSRSFSISCIDTTSYWDNALVYFLNAQQSLGAGGFQIISDGLSQTTAAAAGFPVVPADDGLSINYFATVIAKTLSLDSGPSNKTFLDAFVAVLQSITGINDFYNFANQRLRINDRMLLNSTGLLSTLISTQQGAAWFNGIVNQSGGYTSVRQVVQDLLSLIFHDIVTVPFPARVAVSASALTGSKLTGTSDNSTATVGTYVFKPNMYMIPPPMCNVFFPDEYSQFQYSRNFFKEPTRLIYQPELPFYGDAIGSADSVQLPFRFQPPSFEAFMLHQDTTAFQNKKGQVLVDTNVAGDPGYYLQPAPPTNAPNPTTAKLRIGQFLTNEEMVKGIWMAQERMMPATTAFSTAFDTQTNGALKVSFTEQIAKYLFYKKRFESRQVQITSHLKLSVVPGFNVLILDDSDAQQNIVAYCSAVTHRIYATEGGYTNVTLSYARTPDEEAAASNNGNDPPIPPWFDPKIFGAITTPPKSKADPAGVSAAGQTIVAPSALSTFYQSLLGGKGYKAITDYASNNAEPTLIGAVAFLLNEYRTRRAQSTEDLQSYIATTTGRDYIRMRDAMKFIGASLPPKTDLLPDAPLTDFTGGAFDPNNANNGATTAFRQAPIVAYRTALTQFRGFRG